MLRHAITLIVALWSGHALAQQRPNMLMPVAATCISSPFGPRVIPNLPQAGSYHSGIDLPVPIGSPVRATASGRLLRIQNRGPGGLEVLIQHDGYVSAYSHLASVSPTLSLTEGKVIIAAGEQIGVVGMTGVTTGPHLDFTILRGGVSIDPAPMLGLSLCPGAVMASGSSSVRAIRSAAAILKAGGKIPPSRRYISTR